MAWLGSIWVEDRWPSSIEISIVASHLRAGMMVLLRVVYLDSIKYACVPRGSDIRNSLPSLDPMNLRELLSL